MYVHKSAPSKPPCAHKTPGAEKTKKPKRGGASIRPRGRKRLKSQKGWRGAFTTFRLFRTGSVFSYPLVRIPT